MMNRKTLLTSAASLALAGIATGLLLTFIVYGALRTMARRRLASQHD